MTDPVRAALAAIINILDAKYAPGAELGDAIDAARAALAQEPAPVLVTGGTPGPAMMVKTGGEGNAVRWGAPAARIPPADDLVRPTPDDIAVQQSYERNYGLRPNDPALVAIKALHTRIEALQEGEALHTRLLARAYQRAEAAEARAAAAEQREPVAWMVKHTTDAGSTVAALGFTRDEAQRAIPHGEVCPLYAARGAK